MADQLPSLDIDLLSVRRILPVVNDYLTYEPSTMFITNNEGLLVGTNVEDYFASYGILVPSTIDAYLTAALVSSTTSYVTSTVFSSLVSSTAIADGLSSLSTTCGQQFSTLFWGLSTTSGQQFSTLFQATPGFTGVSSLSTTVSRGLSSVFGGTGLSSLSTFVGSLSTIQLTPITEFIFTSGSNTRVKITDSGRLGIQTATPVQPLDVSGNAQIRGTLYSQTVSIGGVVPTAPLTVLGNATIQGNVSASNFITLSDRRLKEGIHPIEQGLATIDRLSSVYFTWSGTQRADAGFIAQEVKEVIPEAVDEQQGMYYVKYNTVIPHLVRAVQELQEKVRTLEEKIASR